MSDIVERLRAVNGDDIDRFHADDPRALCAEAAETISRLRAQLAESEWRPIVRVEGDVRVYSCADGSYVAADAGGWRDGVFPSIEAALANLPSPPNNTEGG